MTRNDMENDMFYKIFLIHFAAVAESCIPNGFPWFVMLANPYPETVGIVMVFLLFWTTFAEMPPECYAFLMAYKVLRTGIPGVAKRCFTNGFRVLFIGTCGPRRPPPAPPAAAAGPAPAGPSRKVEGGVISICPEFGF